MPTLTGILSRLRRTLLLAPAPDAPAPVGDDPCAIGDDEPFSRRNRLRPAVQRRFEKALAEKGIREFPYPFATMLAFVSDCDMAARLDYEGYRGTFVDELGLDFGDSCKLMNRSWDGHYFDALCIYRYDGAGHPNCEVHRDLEETFGFVEMLREIHLGNVDHYHYFSGVGPRLVRLPNIERCDGTIVAVVPMTREEDVRTERKATGNFNLTGSHLPVLVVVVQARSGRVPDDAEIRLVRRDGSSCAARYRRHDPDDASWHPRLSAGNAPAAWFVYDEDPGSANVPPLAGELGRVEIGAAGSDSLDVECVCLLNVTRRELRPMMDEIFGALHFRTSLLTDHGSRYHVAVNSERRHAEANEAKARQDVLAGLSSRVAAPDMHFSVYGDDPESFAYLLPELRDDYGVRFINPGGASSEQDAHLEILNTVIPCRTRDGSAIYLARRCSGALPTPADGERHALWADQGTRSFPTRLRSILEGHAEHPHAVYPVYTHLGNFKPKTERPDPYYPDDVFRDLQARHYGIGEPASRVLMTRGTVLYDYALMLRSIEPHVTRHADEIHIASWHDSALGRRLPASPAQMHGLTFHVEDRASARIALDGAPIDEIARNPADASGRESVTIVGADIRHAVFDDVEPVGVRTDGCATWAWIEDGDAARGRAFGRVELTEAGTGGVRWEPGALRAPAAQFLAFSVRTSPGAKMAVVLETETGGRFVFGDDVGVAEPVTARYAAATREDAEWTRVVVPFYDLTWSEDARPGGPLPNHRITGIAIVVHGPAGGRADIDGVEFLRPSTTAPVAHDDVIVGGRVLGARAGMSVHASWRAPDGRHGEASRELVDPQGYFYVQGIARPCVCSVEVRDGDGTVFVPRRGRRFDVAGSDLTLEIDANADG